MFESDQPESQLGEFADWERVSEAEWNRMCKLLESDREQLALFRNHNLELQARIRELDKQVDDLVRQLGDVHLRIAKAKAILEFAVRVNSVSIKRIQHALDALEGKDQEATNPLVRPEQE